MTEVEAIKKLIQTAAEQQDHDRAMKYAQAALNAPSRPEIGVASPTGGAIQ